VNSFGSNGEKFNKRDPLLAAGMSPVVFAKKAVESVYFKENETLIVHDKIHLIPIYLRTWFPDLVFFMNKMYKKKMLKHLANSK